VLSNFTLLNSPPTSGQSGSVSQPPAPADPNLQQPQPPLPQGQALVAAAAIQGGQPAPNPAPVAVDNVNPNDVRVFDSKNSTFINLGSVLFCVDLTCTLLNRGISIGN